MKSPLTCFNSKLVRLEGDNVNPKGGRRDKVSIPNWFD